MIVLRHVATQLHKEILVSHFRRFNIRIPTGASTSVWLMPFAVLAVAIVWLVRVVIFSFLVLLLVLLSVAQWKVLLRRKGSADIGPTAPRPILVLRPFGADGRLVLLPQILAGATSALPRTELIEKVIGDAAREVDRQPIALMDHTRLVGPRGVDYMLVGDDWFETVKHMARRAGAVVIVAPPEGQLRDGLARELRFLASEGLERKTILVAPPGRESHSDRVIERAASVFGWVPRAGANPLLIYWRDGEAHTVESLGPDDPFQLEVCKRELQHALHIVSKVA